MAKSREVVKKIRPSHADDNRTTRAVLTERGVELNASQLPLPPSAGFVDAFAIIGAQEHLDVRLVDQASQRLAARLIISRGDVTSALLRNVASFRTSLADLGIVGQGQTLLGNEQGTSAVDQLGMSVNVVRVGRLGLEGEISFYSLSTTLIAEARAGAGAGALRPEPVCRVSCPIGLILDLFNAIESAERRPDARAR